MMKPPPIEFRNGHELWRVTPPSYLNNIILKGSLLAQNLGISRAFWTHMVSSPTEQCDSCTQVNVFFILSFQWLAVLIRLTYTVYTHAWLLSFSMQIRIYAHLWLWWWSLLVQFMLALIIMMTKYTFFVYTISYKI